MHLSRWLMGEGTRSHVPYRAVLRFGDCLFGLHTSVLAGATDLKGARNAVAWLDQRLTYRML